MARALAIALVLVTVGGCRFSFDKVEHGGGHPPRSHSEVNVVVHASEKTTQERARRWLEVNPTVASIQHFDAGLLDSLENVGAGNRDRALCRRAQDMKADYIVRPHSSVTFKRDFECTRYESDLLSKDGTDECLDGYYHNERSIAFFRVTITDTGTCKTVPGISFTRAIAGEERLSRPEAERVLARVEERELGEHGFPWQATITAERGAPTAIPPEGAEPLEDGDVVAAFRGRRYLGLARAAGPGTKRIDAMTCCFQLQPGDVLQQRGAYHLIDVGVGLGLAQLGGSESETLLGLGWHVRRYPIDGGLVLGFAGQWVGDGNDLLNLFTAEAGWLFKVVPGLDLGVLGGAGMGLLQYEGDEPDVGAHASATLTAIFNPLPWLYVQGEVGLAASTSFEDVSRGTDRAVRGLVGELGIGLEFH